MSLKAAYESYLANPTEKALSDNAVLHYITTLTTIHTAASIVKHNAAHRNVVKKKGEKVLDCVEGSNGITLDVDTILEFISGGGAYLPGLDDNFVSDRVVTFPMIHVVHFNADLKIDQIRLYWDQGSLLKQIDVIGARARNWPIRDGKDQARLIASGAANLEGGKIVPSAAAPSAAPTTTKPRAQSNNVTRDPHASLALFASAEDQAEGNQIKAIAPRAQASAKPPPRDYHDLFVGNDSDASPRAPRGEGSSPKKENQAMRPPAPKAQSAKPPPRDYHDLFVGNDSDHSPIANKKAPSPEKSILSPGSVAPKAGAGKNYKPIRLFESGDAEPGTPSSPEKSAYKTHPNKYSHFDFGNGDDAPQAQASRPKTKHQSQWDFEDFTTPVKPPAKIREHDKRNFEWENDEPALGSPSKKAPVPKARPDSDPHFEFQDDGTPAGERRPPGQPRGAGNVRTTGLYQNNLFDENRSPSPEKSKPLAPVTNLQDRRKDFDPHFSMTDVPAGEYANQANKPVTEARKKVVSQMGAQWDATDASPQINSAADVDSISNNNKENVGAGRPSSYAGIKSGGDGMGGKKGASRQWGFGDDSDVEEEKFRASRKSQAPKDNNIWDF